MSDDSSSSKQVASPAELERERKLAQLMRMFNMEEDPRQKEKTMEEYKFWKTQPVTELASKVDTFSEGPIKIQKVEDIPTSPAPLLKEFEWSDVDITDKNQLQEVYELLYNHYVEDIDSTFRLQYPLPMLEWGLKAPGWHKDWNVGVRVKSTGKLVAFISAIPADFNVRGKVVKASEVNFLCVHKKLRNKRLAPILIVEITRRINLTGIFQALFTAGAKIPTPITTCRYYHRSINWKKLYQVGFAALPPGSSEERQIVRFSLPTETSLPLRLAEKRDVPQIHTLLSTYLAKFDVFPIFTEEEVEHWLINPAQDGSEQKVIHCYVVEDKDGKISDMVSFYTLNSTIIGKSENTDINTAYAFYYATLDKDLKQRLIDLFQNALILAKGLKFDVFNALTVQDNPLFLDELKFGPGDGFLNYNLFNYKAAPVHSGLNADKQLERPEKGGMGVIMI